MANLMGASDAEFVDALYRNLLGRAPDPGGQQAMLGRLAAGAKRMELVDMIVQSAEFDVIRRGARFVPAGHFYSPLPGPLEIEAHRTFEWNPATLPGIDLREDAQMTLLKSLAKHYAALPFVDAPTPETRYGYQNTAYSYGDGVILYTMIRHLEPRRIIEVGSGHSSCVILDAVDRLQRKDTEVTFIEPYPELLKHLLRPGDLERRRLHAHPLQACPLAMFAALDAGDILFIDSSHVAKLASDVNYFVFEILPALQRGVFVHIHDIFFPFEYRQDWLEEGRAWNEAYLLRAFLEFNSQWRIELFAHMMAARHIAWFEAHMPLAARSWPAQLWISRT